MHILESTAVPMLCLAVWTEGGYYDLMSQRWDPVILRGREQRLGVWSQPPKSKLLAGMLKHSGQRIRSMPVPSNLEPSLDR